MQVHVSTIPPKFQSFQAVPPGRCFDLCLSEYRLQGAGQSRYSWDENQRPIVAEPSTELIPGAESDNPATGRSVQTPTKHDQAGEFCFVLWPILALKRFGSGLGSDNSFSLFSTEVISEKFSDKDKVMYHIYNALLGGLEQYRFFEWDSLELGGPLMIWVYFIVFFASLMLVVSLAGLLLLLGSCHHRNSEKMFAICGLAYVCLFATSQFHHGNRGPRNRLKVHHMHPVGTP